MIAIEKVERIPESSTRGVKSGSMYLEPAIKLSQMPGGTQVKISDDKRTHTALGNGIRTACKKHKIKNVQLVERGKTLFAKILY